VSSQRGLTGAFWRYRIMAFTTGTLLVVLFFVAIPIQVWGHNKTLEAIVGTAHGFLFMVYLVTALDLGTRLGWLRRSWLKLGLVMLAGIIPFASFYAEHRARGEYQARLQARRPAGSAESAAVG
jgi:integral membrane protein